MTKRPNYICCDASARSEICIHLTREGMPFGVLGIDLPYVHDYSKEEIKIFEKIAENSSVSVKKVAFCMKKGPSHLLGFT